MVSLVLKWHPTAVYLYVTQSCRPTKRELGVKANIEVTSSGLQLALTLVLHYYLILHIET